MKNVFSDSGLNPGTTKYLTRAQSFLEWALGALQIPEIVCKIMYVSLSVHVFSGAILHNTLDS